MKVRIIASTIALAMASQLAPISAHAASDWGKVIGTIIGAAAGAEICDKLEIGKGSGRKVAKGLCAIGGGMIAVEIMEKMDENEANAYRRAEDQAWQTPIESNRDCEWNRGSNRYNGHIRAEREGRHRNTGEVCRYFKSEIREGNRVVDRQEGYKCRNNRGEVYKVEESLVIVNGRVVEETRTETRITPPAPPITPDFRNERDHRERERWDRDRRDPRDRRDREYNDTANLGLIERTTGGTKYRVSLDRPTSLNEVILTVRNAYRVKVVAAVADVVDQRGRISSRPLYRLENRFVDAYRSESSRDLDRYDLVTSITLVLESYGGYSDVDVTVTSNDQVRVRAENGRRPPRFGGR